MYVEPFFLLVQTVPLHRWLVTRLPQWGPKFNSKEAHVGFVVEKVVLATGIFLNNSVFPLSVTASMQHIHSSITDTVQS